MVDGGTDPIKERQELPCSRTLLRKSCTQQNLVLSLCAIARAKQIGALLISINNVHLPQWQLGTPGRQESDAMLMTWGGCVSACSRQGRRHHLAVSSSGFYLETVVWSVSVVSAQRTVSHCLWEDVPPPPCTLSRLSGMVQVPAHTADLHFS